MGLGFVLFALGIVGTIFAAIAGLTFWSLAAYFTQNVPVDERRSVVRMAALFPFACLVWGGAAFIFQAVVNIAVFDHDPGLGDVWRCPLPNGYVIEMIDVTSRGYIFDPKSQETPGIVAPREDAIPDVVLAQLAGRYIAGKTNDHTDAFPVDGFFLLDTQTGKRTDFLDLEALRQASAQVGVELRLAPIEKLYDDFRYTWFDSFAAALLLLPPIAAALLLVRRILRLRRYHSARPIL